MDAADEASARVAAHGPLCDLYAGVRERLGRDVPIKIRTVRPATTDEIDLMKWHDRMVAEKAAHQAAP